MQARVILVSGAPHTSRNLNKLCPENHKLLRKWVDDILFRPAKPGLDEKKVILEEIRRRDPWYKMKHINRFVQRYWDRLHPPTTPRKNQVKATESPSDAANSSSDATKAIRTLLCERIDASDEAINSWAVSLGIEKDVAKGYVKRLRRANETANGSGPSMFAGHLESPNLAQPTRAVDASNGSSAPSHSPSRESGSPELKLIVSTVVSQHRDSSPIILSPRSVSYASGASSPLVGPIDQAERVEECPVASNSESTLLASPECSTVHAPDDHPSPSASALPINAEGSNHRSSSTSPSGTTQDISQPFDIQMAHDDLLIEMPAQMLAPNMSLEDSSCQVYGFPPPVMSAIDSVDFATPVHDVPRLQSFAESSEMLDASTTTESLASKFQPYRDRMDSLLLRIRAARRAQMRQSCGPTT
ncbi:hypothetical protein BD410DRAFT_189897 [Rickenella mellea]|uniref:Uncharacterized protein n=1 Tax=Rickenella mellea TaxID=50990 RepID=A0A4Y7Q629_9AGAM|nr:hypothetical protein BD410DRAFT_189897 [Rickenella mellea]